MEYNRIVAVTGLPGLYEVVSSKNDGALVRSLEDKSTRFVSSRVHNMSHLESIEIYTVRENVPLSEIFSAMKDAGKDLPDVKDNKALQQYFKEVYPDMDFERVYASDMKKMVKWFQVITSQNIDFTAKEETEEAAEEAPAVEEVKAEEAPEAPKARKTKAASKTATAEADTATEEKPKRTRKKKED